MHNAQKITPCLWFDNQAEEAVAFYLSIFKNSKITDVAGMEKPGKRSIKGSLER